jgi:hypothetical protein
MEEKITICDGKYTLIYNDEDGNFRALRYGEEWRSLVGDKLVFAMFCELQAAQQSVQSDSDWPCSNCGYVNKGEWQECRHCQTPRS